MNVKIVFSFISGVIVTLLIVYLFFFRSSLHRLKTNIESCNFITISDVEIKEIDSTIVKYKGVKEELSKFGWQCDVKNISDNPVIFTLDIEFLDKDGFVLTSDTIDSKEMFKDGMNYQWLAPSQTWTACNQIRVKSSLWKKITICRLKPKVVQQREIIVREEQRQKELAAQRIAEEKQQKEFTAQQQEIKRERDLRAEEYSKKLKQESEERIEASRQKLATHEEQRQKELATQRTAEENKKQLLKNERIKWQTLKLGMSKSDVLKLLGKPLSVSSYFHTEMWEYPDIEGSYKTPKVNFKGKETNMIVEGWSAP